MERREQVFVSSTYLDLTVERRAVIQGLLEADCIPAGMELFPASDDEKWDLIKGVIDDSDYYLLIVGGRYGSVDPESDLSYTEMEFDYATSAQKPIMAFLHGNPGAIAADKSELDPSARQKLEAFRAKAEQRMVKYWTTPNDLDGAVAKSLIKIRKSHPAEGWVRARYVLTPEMERDFAELRAKVSELTQQLEAARNSSAVKVPEGLADGDETYEIATTITYWQEDERNEVDYRRKKYRVELHPAVTWNEIITDLGPILMDEANEQKIEDELEATATSKIGENRKMLPKGFGGATAVSVDSDSLRDVLVQLFALGLIEHGTKKRPVSDTAKYWKLTLLGRDRLMRLRAIRTSVSEG